MNLRQLTVALLCSTLLGFTTAAEASPSDDKEQAALKAMLVQPSEVLIGLDGAVVFSSHTVTLQKDAAGKSVAQILVPATASNVQFVIPGHDILRRSESIVPVPLTGKQGMLRSQLLSQQAVLQAEIAWYTKRIDVASASADSFEQVRELGAKKAAAELCLAQIQAALKQQEQQAKGVALLVSLELGQSATQEVTVLGRYRLTDCFWQAQYSLDCTPDQKGHGQVDVRLEAKITQPTSFDWDNVKVTLVAGTESAGQLLPLKEWLIGAEQAKGMPRMLGAAAPMQANIESAFKTEQVSTQFSNEESFASWTPALTTLPQGVSTVLLAKAQWDVNLLWIARPLNKDSAVYVSATHTLVGEEQAWPRAMANVSLAGASVGQSLFEPRAGKVFLSFGQDPQVRLEAKAEPKKSGMVGIINHKRVWEWQWTYTLRNLRPHPITLRIERPLPQSVNDEFSVRYESSPQAKVEEKALVWQVPLQAQGTYTIKHSVEATGPEKTRGLVVAP